MNKDELDALGQQVQEACKWIPHITQEMTKAVVGQSYLVERLLIGLLSNGHVLLEGVPGRAKTTTIKALASCIHAQFRRIQFTRFPIRATNSAPSFRSQRLSSRPATTATRPLRKARRR